MKSTKDIRFERVLVTPEMAAGWLERNYKDQRQLKPMLVEYLVKCLQQGTWNGDLPQPIMISTSGELLDGQHRCHAIIKHGKPAFAWVAYGVCNSAYPDIDSGISRLLYDRVMLTPDEPTRNKHACAVVTNWWFKENKNRGRPTPEEAVKLFRSHESSIIWVVSVQSHDRGLGRVHVAVAMAEMYERNEEKARAMASTVYGGDMKRPNGIRLREFLLKGASLISSMNSGGDMALRRQLYEVTVCACMAELEGKTLKRLTTASWK
jgi:hypothetical protein